MFVLGAHKSGTTDLFHRITAHPDVLRPHKKETNFWCHVNAERAIAAFANRSRMLPVDGTPANFMCRNPFLPKLLHRIFNYDLRVVVLTRSPVKRAWSEYRYFATMQKKWNKRCYYNSDSYGSTIVRQGNASTNASTPTVWHTERSVLEAFDHNIRRQASTIDRCYIRGWKNSVACRSLCRVQLQEDPWVQCPLPRLLPGFTAPLVRVWRESLANGSLHIIESERYTREPAAFLSEVFAFLGVRALSSKEMKAIVALPTEPASKTINDDPPWRTARNAFPHPNTSEFLAAWYQSNANRLGCWE